jgi:hypothetical protein
MVVIDGIQYTKNFVSFFQLLEVMASRDFSYANVVEKQLSGCGEMILKMSCYWTLDTCNNE